MSAIEEESKKPSTNYESGDEIEDEIGDEITEKEFEEKKNQFSLKKNVIIKKMNFVLKREGDIKDIYSFAKVIGQGSFGKVYKAKLQDTNEVRAIKAIPKDKITDPE